MSKFLGCLLFILPLVALTQEVKKESPVSFYGFVRNDFYLDTYKGVNAFQDVFYLYPNYIGVDALGKDINKQASANLLSVVTRGGVNINGPVVWGAKTTGCIEFDFSGKPEVYLLRLRKAYTLFSWDKSSLLVGQNWHPFWGGDAFPRVGALNTGSPFQPFNRSPQVRFDYRYNDLTISATALYQQQYLSSGPLGSSNQYKRDAIIPETVLSLEYNKNGFILGAGFDYNRIKPRVSTTGSYGLVYNTDECLNSFSWMAYGKYTHGKLMTLLKGYYGQNMTHLTMIGGYGVSNYNSTTGKERYTNYSSYSTLFNITYGLKWRSGLLIGYIKNLGTADHLANYVTYGLGNSIMNLSRISPSISYNVPRFSLVAEYERTTAAYGIGEMSLNDGLYATTHSVTNNGVRLVMTYYF